MGSGDLYKEYPDDETVECMQCDNNTTKALKIRDSGYEGWLCVGCLIATVN